MAENIKTIQLRLNTVNQVSKITKAMNLVSMSKLQKFQRKFKEFGDIAAEFVTVKTESFERAEDLPKLVVCFASDLGLASLYNRTLETAVKNTNPDKVYWIGRQGFDR
ncbi:MAG: F0F1 ATP synthase subunit gamma, partial [Weeksellaceae bacterium]|nr:F0F1 ATP synthase subunit gamma [Weeksellaceae bacterium]